MYGTNSSKYVLVLFEKFQFLYAFRDPGKWYGFILIPYVYLFAHGVYFLRKNFKSKNIFFKNGISTICIFIVIIMG